MVSPAADARDGVYALAMSIGFMVAFPLVGHMVLASGWRVAWAVVGASLIFVLAPTRVVG